MSREGKRAFKAAGHEGPLAMPKSYTELHAVFDDHMYFFVVATRQALSGVYMLKDAVRPCPQYVNMNS